MYDMYPWDSASQGDYPPRPLRSWQDPARKAASAAKAPQPRNGSAPTGTAPDGSAPDGSALNGHARDISPAHAVQVALDRRDNGGEGHPASHAATSPAASQGRQ
jgi:hypothetical protein